MEASLYQMDALNFVQFIEIEAMSAEIRYTLQ